MNRRTISSRLLAVALACAVPISGMQAAVAEPVSTEQNAEQYTSNDVEIDEFLNFIDNVPDELVSNGTDDDIALYLRNAAPETSQDTVTSRNAFTCAGAIALIVAGTVVPIAKVVNVVRAVKALGGAKRVSKLIKESGGIKKIIATRGRSIKAKDVKDQLLSLASELSGIGLAMEQC